MTPDPTLTAGPVTVFPFRPWVRRAGFSIVAVATLVTAAGKRGVEKIPDASICNSILKPFDLDRFIEIISECLNKSHETH